MKRLPIGRQEFESIREEGFVYIDKTPEIYQLLIGSGRYFFSRPRRFGKSLTISTLDAIFKGRADLFEGLWIFDQIDWKSYPVLRFSFDQIVSQGEPVEALLTYKLHELAKENRVVLEGSGIKHLTIQLIKKCSAFGKVVVLIDEYDKPILDALPHDVELAESRRNELKGFFEALKSIDRLLHFVFVTGVTKFSKTTMFSGPNQLSDLTIVSKFATLCGYTQAELVHYFSKEIEEVGDSLGFSKEGIWKEIKRMYNGYAWRGEKVYNPWSVLNMLFTGQIDNFWFNSGSPSFLMGYLKEGLYYDIAEFVVSDTVLENFDFEKIDYRALLFQGGYLTIKDENKRLRLFTLGFPNEEVESALSQLMLNSYREIKDSDSNEIVLRVRKALENEDIEGFVQIVNALFAEIPYQLFLAKYEAYYHSILHIFFRLIGLYVQSEVSTANGRADIILILSDKIYIFEFKINDTAKNALSQIIEKGYADKYKTDQKKIFLVGLSLSKESKGIAEFDVKII